MVSFSYGTLVAVVLIILSIGFGIFGFGNALKGNMTHDKQLENKGCLTLVICVVIFFACIVSFFL